MGEAPPPLSWKIEGNTLPENLKTLVNVENISKNPGALSYILNLTKSRGLFYQGGIQISPIGKFHNTPPALAFVAIVLGCGAMISICIFTILFQRIYFYFQRIYNASIEFMT